jgi:hypothetical protein
MKSTMECFQSSSCVAFSFKASSTAATSTVGPGGVDAADAGAGAEAGAAAVVVPAFAEGAAWTVAPGEAGVLPNTFDMIVPNILIASSLFARLDRNPH